MKARTAPAKASPEPTLSALDISALLGQRFPPTAQQQAIIEAPLEPQLVVAGAGSGKTETMAARVVWLIANSLAAPRDILGLTFTRKAAFELDERINERLAQLARAMREHRMRLPEGLSGADHELIAQRPHVHTYNGFALDLVKEHALRIGVDPEFTVLTPAGAWQLAYDLVDSYAADLPFNQSSATIASAVVSLSGSLADHLVEARDFDSYLRDIETTTMNLPLQSEGGKARTSPAPVRELWERLEQRRALVPLLDAFAERKRERQAIDFSDQVALAARIVREAPTVVKNLREQYPVVLLDEFQDTSVGQLEFLDTAFGSGHATCAVGDPNQAIYGWRGASAASLTTYAERFGTARRPVRQYSLTTSFRNDALILDAANAIGATLTDPRSPVELPVLRPRPGAGPGEVTVARFPDTRAEADGIATWIAQIYERAQDVEEGLAPPPVPSVAILIRHRAAIPALTAACERHGLPFHVVGGGGLLHEPEVADVRALLEVADSSDRGDSLMRLLEGPRFHLGRRDIVVLGRWRAQLEARIPAPRVSGDHAAFVTLADAVEQLPPENWCDPEGRSLSVQARERLRELREVLQSVRAHAALELPELVTLATRLLGTDIAVLSDPARDPQRALANLEEFRSHAARYSAGAPQAGLSAFLAFLDVTAEKEAGLAAVEDAEIPDGAVIISTVHASKGLEWDHVAIAGLAEGTFPSYHRASATSTDEAGVPEPKDRGWLASVALASIPIELRGDSDMLEELRWAEAETQKDLAEALEEFRRAGGSEKLREETRLMYVALTRARLSLHLSWAPWREGATTSSLRSRFLDTLDTVPSLTHVSGEEPAEVNPLVSSPSTAQWPRPASTRVRARHQAEALVEAQMTVANNPADGGGEHREGEAVRAQLASATEYVIAALAAAREAREVHLPLRLSPSDLVALTADADAQARLRDIVRPMPRRPSGEAARGTRFHAWVESQSVAPALLDLDDLAHDDRDGDSSPDASGPVLSEGSVTDIDSLREKFARSRFASMAPIAVERPVALALSGAYMPGVIDAVFRDPADPGGVWIVDWKTGRVPHGADLDRKALQLSVYRLAWHQHEGTPLEKIRTFFHYVAAERTVEITDHASVSDLERLLAQMGESPSGEGLADF